VNRPVKDGLDGPLEGLLEGTLDGPVNRPVNRPRRLLLAIGDHLLSPKSLAAAAMAANGFPVNRLENRPLEGPLEGLLDGPLDTLLHRGLSAVDQMLLAELIEPANLLHRLDLPPTTLTHLLELQYHALLFPSPELLSLLPVQ